MRIKSLDWLLNFETLFLFAAGILSLSSTASSLAWFQLLWGVIGLGIVILLANFDWRPFVTYRWFIFGIYTVAILLLLITYFAAVPVRGVRAWLSFGLFQFQTSELAKLSLILLYSYFFAKQHIGIAHLSTVGVSLIYFLIPAGLIMAQPDMGTALILFGIWFGYLLVSGLRWKHIFLAAALFAITLVFLWTSFLKPYQKERIIGLFNPERDPLGVNYSVIQAKIAVGSAGFWGKGFGQGTQSQLGFLPESQTDFIFAAFIEEWGAIGGIAITAAFLFLLFRIMKIGLNADSNFAKLLCLGVSMLWLLHFSLNVGSNLGLLPVIGVPFPFLSYGGSNLLINALLVGMIQSIVVHRRF
ncbi:MAG: rod shape-determining protein RodA [Candidatus Harrisonbacteria bacterium]|nr:rod shape-determining protein RodA [Candidatus Harrisonbacteria bacterium]